MVNVIYTHNYYVYTYRGGEGATSRRLFLGWRARVPSTHRAKGMRLAAINAELAERKKEGKRKALDSFANYQKTSGKIYMPFVSPLSGETERGSLVPWKITERNQTAKTVLAVSFDLG